MFLALERRQMAAASCACAGVLLARKLLYVGLTRARDLLIQALPEKTPDGGLLESLGPGAATLLTPALPGMTSLTLPSGF